MALAAPPPRLAHFRLNLKQIKPFWVSDEQTHATRFAVSSMSDGHVGGHEEDIIFLNFSWNDVFCCTLGGILEIIDIHKHAAATESVEWYN